VQHPPTTENTVEGTTVGEKDKVLLGEVPDHLDVVAADVQLILKGVSDVVNVGVMVVVVEPAVRRLADEIVPLALDVPRRGDGADHLVRASTGITRVGGNRRHLPLGNLQVGVLL
jgi:hypothetical protein